MYASGYSEVSKYSPQTKKKMQYHSKGKSCGYYMRIIFFFSSLIQSLIIVSLVLFLIYGKDQDSASTSRIQDLEESFSRLSIENVALRQQRKNLTNLLNATLTEKARNDWDLYRLRVFSNISASIIQDQEKRILKSSNELNMCNARAILTGGVSGPCPMILPGGGFNCERVVEHVRAKLGLVEANFTQTYQRLSREKEEIAKERDHLNLQAIGLRREKFMYEKEVEFCKQSCQTDFANSLNGISNVTKAFLQKIDSLFPSHLAFQLTCARQREHLEQIRFNCTSLSREVEDKFQRYLDSVGAQMSTIHSENSRLKAENLRFSEDYRWCTQNRTAMIAKNKRNLEDLQQKQDIRMERVLLEKQNLNGELTVLNNSVNYKNKEVEHLKERLKQLEVTCNPKTMIDLGGLPGGSRTGSSSNTGSWNLFGGGSSSTSQLGRTGSTFNKPGSTGSLNPSLGSGSSTGSGYNKPASTGTGSTGSSFFSTGSGSSTGSGLNKPASTGTGSTGSSFFSTGSGSSTGSGYNKPASTGTGSTGSSFFSTGSGSSTGSGLNKPASTGTGSTGSSFFSTGSGSSTGSGYNKPASTGTGSSSTSLLSSGTGSSTGLGFKKPGGGGFFGLASSNPSVASSGTNLNKPTLTGRSSSTTGSTGSSTSFGSSATSSTKPSTNTRSSSSSSTSSGSTGTGNKNSAFSWFGLGSSSKTGSENGKGPSAGNSYGGNGFDGGRPHGQGGGPYNVAQHIRDLQLLINPSGPEEKQDLSRIMG
ncbi:plasmalemma vesicle associated protein a isoform X4 [Nelusetta ayraudi]|uniref:plasmalemma vesicle associated protein a isoform X4 n=1 Tax=Nelusetta ayraudi TaxID=303726 RepID=UPI003F70F366